MKKYSEFGDEQLKKNPKLRKESFKTIFLKSISGSAFKSIIQHSICIAIFDKYVYDIIDKIIIDELEELDENCNKWAIRDRIPIKTCLKIYKKCKKNLKKQDTFKLLSKYDRIILSLGLLYNLSTFDLIEEVDYNKIYTDVEKTYYLKYKRKLNRSDIEKVSCALNETMQSFAIKGICDRLDYNGTFNFKYRPSMWNIIHDKFDM